MNQSEVSLEVLQDRFKKSMSYLYPDGIESPAQWRDLVQVYMMGWFDVLQTHDLKSLGRQWYPLYKPIAQPGWWPDDAWKWW